MTARARKTVLVATVGRSDYGIYRPVLDAIANQPALNYEMLVTGSHLAEGSASTLYEILKDDRPIAAQVPLPPTSGGESAMAAAMAAAIAGVGPVLERRRPDLLLVLGDRFEMFALSAAATAFNVPIAHIHGGEVSFGAVDDVFRHAITKMAQLHFTATAEYARRVMQMGEEPWRVVVSGAPALDTVRTQALPDADELSKAYGFPLGRRTILATYHPVTRRRADQKAPVRALFSALAQHDAVIVVTAPNADPGADAVREEIAAFIAAGPNRYFVENFGALNYLAMLKHSTVVVGNSSSGIIEAPSFRVPVVNIGDRQAGRTRAANIIDVGETEADIASGLAKAFSSAFRDEIANMTNPFGDGHAGEIIAATLTNTDIDARFVNKLFVDRA